MKRLTAPHHWMLDKLTGRFVRTSSLMTRPLPAHPCRRREVCVHLAPNSVNGCRVGACDATMGFVRPRLVCVGKGREGGVGD